jgi:hypothetical protein
VVSLKLIETILRWIICWLILGSPAIAQTKRALLIGHWTGSGPEYTWMNKNISESDSKSKWSSDEHGNVCMPDSSYPPRTNWISLGMNSESVGSTAENLMEFANRLARVRSWFELPVPPGGANDVFPYRLALKKVDSIADANEEVVQDGTVVEGGEYGLVLRQEGKISVSTPRRWVYVMAIECNGEGQLLYPRSGEGNFLPEKSPTPAGWPTEIDQTGKNGTFTISSPFGIETYILLTTADQIADLSAFNFSGVLQAAHGGPRSPFAQLLGNASANARGMNSAVPVNWSVQYMPIRSVAAEKGAIIPQL